MTGLHLPKQAIAHGPQQSQHCDAQKKGTFHHFFHALIAAQIGIGRAKLFLPDRTFHIEATDVSNKQAAITEGLIVFAI